MSGRRVIAFTLVLCVSLVVFALWQRSQHTARIRQFWGGQGAHLIQYAPQVQLQSGADRIDWLELSAAPGLIHLRATLVDDRYYVWPSRAASAEELAAAGAAYHTLRFSDRASFVDATINTETGAVINRVNGRAAQLIPSSRQAVAAYLQLRHTQQSAEPADENG